MRQLMRVAGLLDVARLVLVGDRSQLRAVEAGQPFRQLQDAGMTTARMDDILRQRNPELRAAVLSVLEGDPGRGGGDARRRVDYGDLGVKAAEAWLALDAETRDNTLLLAPSDAWQAAGGGGPEEGGGHRGVQRFRAPALVETGRMAGRCESGASSWTAVDWRDAVRITARP